MGISAPATPPPYNQNTLTSLSEIVNQLAGQLIRDCRTNRHFDDDVCGVGSVPVTTFTVPTSASNMLRVIAKM